MSGTIGLGIVKVGSPYTLPAQPNFYVKYASDVASNLNYSNGFVLTWNGSRNYFDLEAANSVIQIELNDTLTSNSTLTAATANMANTLFAYIQYNTNLIQYNINTINVVSNTLTLAYNQANLAYNIANSINLNTNNFIANTITANNIIANNYIKSSIIQTNTQNTNYIIQQSDSGLVILMNNPLQANINVNNTLTIGFRCIVTSVNTGNVTIVAGSNVTINVTRGTNKTLSGQWNSASIFCWSANNFILDGSIV